MKMENAGSGNTGLQFTENDQMKSAQDQIFDNLLQAPLSEEGFDQLLTIIDERQRADIAGELVRENPNRQPGDVPVSELLVQVAD